MLVDEGRRYRCNRCGRTLPATREHFYFSRTGNVIGYCRDCMGAYQRERTAGLSDYLRDRYRRQRREYARRTRGYDPARFRVLP